MKTKTAVSIIGLPAAAVYVAAPLLTDDFDYRKAPASPPMASFQTATDTGSPPAHWDTNLDEEIKRLPPEVRYIGSKWRDTR